MQRANCPEMTHHMKQIDDIKNPSAVTVKRKKAKADQKLKEEEASIKAYKKKVLAIKKARVKGYVEHAAGWQKEAMVRTVPKGKKRKEKKHTKLIFTLRRTGGVFFHNVWRKFEFCYKEPHTQGFSCSINLRTRAINRMNHAG